MPYCKKDSDKSVFVNFLGGNTPICHSSGLCYWTIESGSGVDRDGAQDLCQADNGTLAVIPTTDLWEFVKNHDHNPLS